MKTITWLSDTLIVLAIAAFMTILLAGPAHSQDTLKNDSKTVVTVKIIKDENGQRTVIDTVYTTGKPLNSKEIHVIMSGLDEDMKDMDDDMEDITLTIDELGLPDSVMMDSIAKVTGRVIKINRNMQRHHCKIHGNPGGYGYDFDFDIPEPPMPPGPPCGDFHGFRNFDQFEDDFCRREHDKGSILDILGDIPMDRIKNFSIREKKNSTKITIEVDRESLLNPPCCKEKVIIIRPERGARHGSGPDHKVQKKVIIKTEK